jgi:hypothetical protein
MTYALTVLSLVAAGLALLDLLRLRTGHALPDAALGWLAGSGWLAAVAPALRFALGVPLGRPTLAAVLLAPIVAWGALRLRARVANAASGVAPSPQPSPPAGEREVGAAQLPSPAGEREVGAQASSPSEMASRARWIPRPLWLFAPIALYVAVVLAAVLLHGANTPTNTDDGVRVRAFAPMLAFDDGWEPAARAVFAQAAPLATFVPAVAWIATGAVDHFHVNYFVLTELVALLALAIGLGVARGSPERGWAGAFAVLSLPLFVYHATSTYSDAVLAMRVGGAILFAVEYARGRDRADLSRALLLLGFAALVKREGELVAAAPAAVLLAQAAWERWRGGRPLPWRAAALLVAPGLVAAIGKVAALGVAGAFPMLGFVFQQAAEAAGAGAGAPRAPGLAAEAAAIFFGDSLFRSGNQGMLYWILVAVLVVRARAILRGELVWPLLAVGAVFAEVAVSSIVLTPQFTLDQSTVNRALLVASVPVALWVAAAVVEAVRAEAVAETDAPADGPRARGGEGDEAATPPRRRRSRRASRR